MFWWLEHFYVNFLNVQYKRPKYSMVFCLFFFFIKWQKSLLPLTGRVKTFQIEGNSIDIGGKKSGKEKKLQNKEKQTHKKNLV